MITRYTIAILPFRDLSPKNNNEYLCDGITEEIQNALVKIDGLAVTARTSSFYYKQKEPDVEKIGKELKVQAILKGSVKLVKNEIRINLQLIDTTSFFIIWSEVYQQKLQEIYELESMISLQVAEKIREYYGHFEIEENLKLPEIDNFGAYNLYLKGRYYLNKSTYESSLKAIEIFNETIKTEPNHAQAYAGLSKAYTFIGITGQISPQEVYLKSRKYAGQALKINNQIADIRLALAYISFFFEWDIKNTFRHIYEALKISPGLADAHWFYAMVLMSVGKKDEALNESEIALRLDPLSLHCNHYTGVVNQNSGNYEAAIDCFNAAISLDPYYSLAHILKAYCLVFINRVEEAIQLFEKIPAGQDMFFREYGGLGYVYAVTGKTEKAEYCLEKLNETSGIKSPVDTENSKMAIYLALNRFENAQEIFDKQFIKRSPSLLVSKFDPLFKPILDLPCYKKFDDLLESGIANYQSSYSRYRSSGLNKEDALRINDMLLQIMKEKKPYLDPELSLSSLAGLLETNSNYLSQVINEYQKKNFFDFINAYRIDHFTREWKDPKNRSFTLLSLAFSAGFNSKTTFNTSFKKLKGKTPKQYLRSLQ